MSEAVKHTKFNIYDFFLANNTRKTYTNLGISLILILILIFFALMPTFNTIDKIKEKIETYQTLNSQLITKIKSAQNLNEQLNFDSSRSDKGVKLEIEFMNKVFFNEVNLVDLYNNFSERAKKSNVAISDFTPRYESQVSQNSFERSDDSPSSLFFEVNLNVEGKNLVDVENFISQLEAPINFPIVSRVRNVSIKDVGKEAKSEDPEELVIANISMYIYLDSTRTENLITDNLN